MSRPRRAPRAVYARVPGHELLHDGAPHNEQGRVIPAGTSTAGSGRARCSCGTSSQVMVSGTRRRQWHREHKATVTITGA